MNSRDERSDEQQKTVRFYQNWGWEDNFVPAGDIWQCVETFLVVATRGSTRYYWVGVKDTTDSPT